MKKSIFLLLVPAIIISLGSCQKIKDSLTVDVPVEFEVDLDVTTGSDLKSNPGVFFAEDTFDPAGSEELEEYLEKIQGYTLTGMQGTVEGLTEQVTLITAQLSVSNGTETVQWTFSDLTINNGSVLSLTNDNGQWTTISEMLSEMQVITVSFGGLADKPGVVWSLICHFEALVKAGIF